MKKWKIVIAVVLAGIAGIASWQNDAILAWYHVRQLVQATPENREQRADAVAAYEDAALPGVLDGLQADDATSCANLQAALSIWVKRWGPANPRSIALVDEIHGRFERFSVAGQEQALMTLATLLQQDGPRPLSPKLTRAVSEILAVADQRDPLRPAALTLAAELLACVQPGQWADLCRNIAVRGLADDREPAKLAALHLVQREPLHADAELLEKAVPLLADPQASVRRAALIALASARDIVREETLLPRLHDDDAQVQYLCELALRKRGLTDDDLKLARLISDNDPAIRMHVFRFLRQMPDLNHAEWLRQLSHDPAAAVRAAAVREIGESAVDLTERLREMADRDPSDAVRQNAQYYLRQRVMRTARD